MIKELKNRCPQAFHELYQAYAPSLNALICRHCNNPRQRRVMLQDLFITAWRDIGNYEENRGSLYLWLVQLCRQQIDRQLQSVQINPRLPHQQRTILYLVYFMGFSYQQTARVLKMPLETVAMYVENARLPQPSF